MPYNPFAGWRVTGTWADHMSYSAGGTDYPLGYGTPLPAPASGVLYTAGQAGGYRGGEFTCGWVGSAGRRSILILDAPIGDVVAVVFQHQSRFGLNASRYLEGAVCGWSGASANLKDYGGDVHLHIHCLTASGSRRDFTRYFTGSAAAGGDRTPLEEDDMYTDADRARDTLTHEAMKRTELHAWYLHKVIDELRFVLIGNAPGESVRTKLDEIVKRFEADFQKPADG